MPVGIERVDASSATSSLQNMRASSRAASAAKRRSSSSSGSMSPIDSSAQRVSTRSTMRRLSRVAPPGSPMKPPSRMASTASRNAGVGRGRQFGLLVERPEAGAAPVVQQCAHALDRHVGKFRQRLLEHLDIARQQRPQHEAGVQLPAFAQMPDQRRNLGRRRDRGERDRRLLAGLLGDALGAILVEPGARGDKAGERLGQFCDQRLPRRRGQILAHQHRFADRGEMAMARDDAIERERNDRRRCRSRSAPGRLRRAPTSAMAAETAQGKSARRAIAA